MAFDIPVIALRTSEFKTGADDLLSYLQERQAQGQPMYAALRNPVTLELRGGKMPVPDAQPFDVSSEGVPLYRMLDLGWNPATQQRETTDVNEVGGAPELRGTFVTVPARRWGEVHDFDASMKWAFFTVPMNYPDGSDARLHPHQAAGWLSFNDLRPIDPPRSPFRKR